MLGPELFPDVELIVCDFLRTTLPTMNQPYATGVHVANRLPNPRPLRAITVRRDGGRRVDEVREVARVGINIWTPTDQDATDLARLTAGLLHTWTPVPVMHVETLSAFSPVADESGTPRRYGTFEMVVASTTLTIPT